MREVGALYELVSGRKKKTKTMLFTAFMTHMGVCFIIFPFDLKYWT